MNKLTRITGAAAAATLVAIGGSAFTASNTVQDSVAGYGTSTVSGAVTTAIEHTLNGTGDKIDSTTITFDGAQAASTTVGAAFGTAALETCVLAQDFLTATCTWATPQDTVSAEAFRVAVS